MAALFWRFPPLSDGSPLIVSSCPLAVSLAPSLQHLEADLVDEFLRIYGQQLDLLEVAGVAKAAHWLPELEDS